MPNSPALAPASAASDQAPRVVCFVNGIYTDHITGGDIYFAYIARGMMAAGYSLHFFGGHAFKQFLSRQELPLNLTLTDCGIGRLGDVSTVRGQLLLLGDYVRRAWATCWRLREVRKTDLAYGATDAWFDTLPLFLCRARAKVFHLGMTAPTLWEVVARKRADVTPNRLAALYYWLSQHFSLRLFRLCRRGFVTYAHPEIRDYLLSFGYREDQIAYVGNAVDVTLAERVPAQVKEFDVVWTGRVHPQKGIDDLLELLRYLQVRLPRFKALIIGKARDALEPRVRALGLAGHVVFSGLVSEEEKFRLLKASRVFVMPSRYESWGIVVGEALAAGLPVVTYELGCYRQVFGSFLHYVTPFDIDKFLQTVEAEVCLQRKGQDGFAGQDFNAMKHSIRWETSQQAFCNLLTLMCRRFS